jgi:hypothetical protein
MPQVRIPRHADPVEFEPLYLKLGGGVFEVPAGPRVVRVVQKPVDRVDLDSDVDGVRLEALSPRRSHHAVPFCATDVIPDPSLSSSIIMGVAVRKGAPTPELE